MLRRPSPRHNERVRRRVAAKREVPASRGLKAKIAVVGLIAPRGIRHYGTLRSRNITKPAYLPSAFISGGESDMIRTFLVLAIAVWALPAHAGQISGQARAIDSTTIRIGDQRVMLFGVDSVLRKQLCTLEGKPWQCWQAAVNDLQTLLDQGQVVCDTVGEPDVYGRLLGRCKVNDQSVNELLVSRGFAVARTNESTDYVAAEAAAKEKKLGLWRGQFALPSVYRSSAGVAVDRP
jgi:endonuclease YncB( thermonuclease family)